MTHKLHSRFQLSLLSNQTANKVGNEPNPHRFGNLWQRIDIYLFFHSLYSLLVDPFWSINFLSIIFLSKIQYQSIIDSGSHFDSKMYLDILFCFLDPTVYKTKELRALRENISNKAYWGFLTTYLSGFLQEILLKK